MYPKFKQKCIYTYNIDIKTLTDICFTFISAQHLEIHSNLIIGLCYPRIFRDILKARGANRSRNLEDNHFTEKILGSLE